MSKTGPQAARQGQWEDNGGNLGSRGIKPHPVDGQAVLLIHASGPHFYDVQGNLWGSGFHSSLIGSKVPNKHTDALMPKGAPPPPPLLPS